jgi:AcrR family transcriptional regulator
MTMDSKTAEAKARLLDAADRLFMERGYKAVTLRDIANAVGIKHASIYHHAPGGKQQLFVEVMQRTMRTHREGLTAALTGAPTLRAGLYAAADWVLAHPPMDMMRMTMSDLAALPPEDSARLSELASAALLQPLEQAIVEARARGEVVTKDPGAIGAALLTLIEGLHAMPEIAFTHPHSKWHGCDRKDVARFLIDSFFAGLSPRDGREDGAPTTGTDAQHKRLA